MIDLNHEVYGTTKCHGSGLSDVQVKIEGILVIGVNAEREPTMLDPRNRLVVRIDFRQAKFEMVSGVGKCYFQRFMLQQLIGLNSQCASYVEK